jgi:hypothetical protein
MASGNPSDYRPLGGRSRRYLDITTGETLSRRQYDQRFRLPAQGYRSFEEKAAARHAPRASTLDRFYAVVRRLAGGERSLTRAARAKQIALATVQRVNQGRGTFSPRYALGKGTGRGVLVGYDIHRAAGRVSFWSADAVFHEGIPFDRQMLIIMAHYDNAVRWALEKNNQQLLAPYTGLIVYDLYGNAYQPLTDLNALYAVHVAAEPLDIAPLFTSEEVVLGAS